MMIKRLLLLFLAAALVAAGTLGVVYTQGPAVSAQSGVTEALCRAEHSASAGSFVTRPADIDGNGVADTCVLDNYFGSEPGVGSALKRLQAAHHAEYECHLAAVRADKPSDCDTAPQDSSDDDPPSDRQPDRETERDDEEQRPSAGLRVADLRVAPERAGGYNRNRFDHWVDADGDGCDARKEVLIAESLTPVRRDSRCSLFGGSWVSPFDGVQVQGSGSGLDVDHMVPLKEAWESGAWQWSDSDRERFANDLGYEHSLVAVTASSNRSKGARDPAEWLPPDTGAHCWYASAWVAVKVRWELSADSREVATLERLERECGGLDDAALPVAAGPVRQPVTETPEPEPNTDTPDGDCHPAYEPCLPNLPGDALNCGDIPRDKKPVTIKQIGVDPYRLDGNNDGVACKP